MTQAQTGTKCVHHWRIEAPMGPTALGTCRKCGATKSFPNYVDYAVGATAMREVTQRGWW